ncbi:MAG: phytanoyl-CoA dioxygenase family protein [Lentisphaerae bacterium]|nr:phytanoyl-CoA dioxygenase family protein [Lentisphaerota bacterium]
MKHDPQRWKEDYERDGYLVVEDAVDADTLARLRIGIEDITADPDSLPPALKRFVNFERDYMKERPALNDLSADDVGNAVRNIMELPRFAPLFGEFILYAPLLDILEALFESSEFHFHNYKCIVKAPRVSSRFCWHRDLPYLEHSTSNLITAMVCLDPMTAANGATVVLPGSHRLVGETSNPKDTDIAEEDLPAGDRVLVTCPAGSIVLFHVNIVHGGGANRSDIPRRNVIGIWSGPDTYPIKGHRYHYQGLYPRSTDPARQKQVRLSLPHL